jgi:Arc/MetJ-type ribon-helix-helix transcriptional regulator
LIYNSISEVGHEAGRETGGEEARRLDELLALKNRWGELLKPTRTPAARSSSCSDRSARRYGRNSPESSIQTNTILEETGVASCENGVVCPCNGESLLLY